MSSRPTTFPARQESAGAGRLGQVDSLRAIAALAVMWLHFHQFLDPGSFGPSTSGAPETWPPYFDPGRLGVLIFFAISGFVICRSFGERRRGSVRKFLIRRVCRLYPAYWLSMFAALAVWMWQGVAWSWADLAANASMIPGTLGYPRLIGVYWTLEVELLFYVLCVALHLARWIDRQAVLAALVLLLLWSPKLLRLSDELLGTHLTLGGTQASACLGLAIMFWGALFRLAYDLTDGFRANWRAQRSRLLLLAVLTFSIFDAPNLKLKWILLGLQSGEPGQQVMTVGALSIFIVWVAVLRIRWPALTYLGLLSYSMYLFHLLVLELCNYAWSPMRLGAWWQPPAWLVWIICAAMTIAVAALVYHFVEKPAIAFGRRWVGPRDPKRVPQAQTA